MRTTVLVLLLVMAGCGTPQKAAPKEDTRLRDAMLACGGSVKGVGGDVGLADSGHSIIVRNVDSPSRARRVACVFKEIGLSEATVSEIASGSSGRKKVKGISISWPDNTSAVNVTLTDQE